MDKERFEGLPQTRHETLTPFGEIEQVGKMAHGLRQERHGWRKHLVSVGGISLLLGLVVIPLSIIVYLMVAR